MLSAIWVAFLVLALICGAFTGRLDAVTTAVGTGAGEAVTLIISIAGLMCFWSGIMELVQKSYADTMTGRTGIGAFCRPVTLA